MVGKLMQRSWAPIVVTWRWPKHWLPPAPRWESISWPMVGTPSQDSKLPILMVRVITNSSRECNRFIDLIHDGFVGSCRDVRDVDFCRDVKGYCGEDSVFGRKLLRDCRATCKACYECRDKEPIWCFKKKVVENGWCGLGNNKGIKTRANCAKTCGECTNWLSFRIVHIQMTRHQDYITMEEKANKA